MAVATTYTVTLRGLMGHLIHVEADVSQGVVSTTIVGRPDAALSEARDRCRMAVANSGFEWPTTRRVTILLSPADLPKSGSHFDLPIAVSVLAGSGQVPVAALADTAFFGELSLQGALRSVQGVLPMIIAAREQGIRRVFVPEPQAAEAALVPGMSVFGVRSLAQVVAELRAEEVPDAPPVAGQAAAPIVTWRGQERRAELDLRDLVGVDDARYALEVAAAGGHHLLLSGPRGAGKTSLAERIPGLLPDLTTEEALELTAIHSLAGTLGEGSGLIRRPPFFAPHHSASAASLLGGGSGKVRPGEISRSHCGVLFLDEFPLFASDVIDALRQPLESGEVTIARGEESATFPARGLVVLAANPCPCGDFHPDPRHNGCTCGEVRRRNYRRKVDGPVADRIDIVRHLGRAHAAMLPDPFGPPPSTETVRQRVEQARERQRRRHHGRAWRLNGQVPGPALIELWPLTDGQEALDRALLDGRLSRRGATRAHRLAWTVADLDGADQPTREHVDIALRLRLGEPLPAVVGHR